MSEIMHLETCHDNSSTDVRETSRRIVWSLYVIDRWSSSGLGLPRSTDHLQQIIPLPINEMQFDALPRGNSIQLNSSEAPGLFAHMVKLVYNFGPIQDLNRSIATGQIQADLGRSVKAVEQQLDLWRDMLPADMQMTLQNLHDNQEVGLGAAFMALHLSYHHFSTLLYFHVLENNSVLSMAQSEHVARCKFHAASFSRILHLSQQVKGCEPNYTTIGHMTTVSSAVLVHTLLHGETQELDKARRDLNQNFAALLELHRSCPAVDVMVGTRFVLH